MRDGGFGEIRNRYHRGSGGAQLRNSVVITRAIWEFRNPYQYRHLQFCPLLMPHLFRPFELRQEVISFPWFGGS